MLSKPEQDAIFDFYLKNENKINEKQTQIIWGTLKQNMAGNNPAIKSRAEAVQYYAECDSYLKNLSSKPAQSSAIELDPSPISRGVSGMKRVASLPLQGEEGLVEEPVPHKVARTSTSNGLIVNRPSATVLLEQGDRTQNLIYYLSQYQAEQELNRLLGIELEKAKAKEKEQAQKIDSLNELTHSLQSGIERLNEKKEEASLTIGTLESQKALLQEEVSKFSTLQAKQRLEIESLKVQISGLEQELRSILAKAKLAEQQKKNARDEVIFLRQEKIKYNEKIQQLEHQQEEAQQREDGLSEQCETYQKEIEKQAVLIRMFHEQSNSLAEKEARLEEEMQLTSQNQDLNRQLTERRVQIISQEQAIDTLQKEEIEKLRKEVALLKEGEKRFEYEKKEWQESEKAWSDLSARQSQELASFRAYMSQQNFISQRQTAVARTMPTANFSFTSAQEVLLPPPPPPPPPPMVPVNAGDALFSWSNNQPPAQAALPVFLPVQGNTLENGVPNQVDGSKTDISLTPEIADLLRSVDVRIQLQGRTKRGVVSAFGIKNENSLTGAYLMFKKIPIFIPFKEGLSKQMLQSKCVGPLHPPLYNWVEGLTESGQMRIDKFFITKYIDWIDEQRGGIASFPVRLNKELFDWNRASFVNVDQYNHSLKKMLNSREGSRTQVRQTGESASLPTMQVLESAPVTEDYAAVSRVTTSQSTVVAANLPPPLPPPPPSPPSTPLMSLDDERRGSSNYGAFFSDFMLGSPRHEEDDFFHLNGSFPSSPG